MYQMRLVLCPASSHRTPFVVSVFLTSTEACHAAHLTDTTHCPLEVKWISKRLLVWRWNRVLTSRQRIAWPTVNGWTTLFHLEVDIHSKWTSLRTQIVICCLFVFFCRKVIIRVCSQAYSFQLHKTATFKSLHQINFPHIRVSGTKRI